MPQPNLLKIDDQLIRAGSMLAGVWLLGSLVGLTFALNDSLEWRSLIAAIALFPSAPIGLWMAGARLRKRERRAWALHRLVEDYVEIPATDLLRDSDFTAATLDRAIRDLNNSGCAFLVWDRAADVVQDGRLRAARIMVEECGACGAKVSIRVRVGDIDSTRCPYCRDFIAAEGLIEEKAELIDELRTDPAIISARTSGDSDFSIVVFAFLVVVFWPLGIGYAFWKWRASQKDDSGDD
jgi:hypothetical protein